MLPQQKIFGKDWLFYGNVIAVEKSGTNTVCTRLTSVREKFFHSNHFNIKGVKAQKCKVDHASRSLSNISAKYPTFCHSLHM